MFLDHKARRTVRNRQLMAEFENGITLEALTLKYSLGQSRVKAILAEEKHKRAHSLDSFYVRFRQSRFMAGAQKLSSALP